MLLGIISVFLVLGFSLPFINSSFGQSSTDLNTGGLVGEAGQAQDGVGAAEVVLSIFTIFFFTFGQIPLWLDATVMMIMRLGIALLSYRLIRGI